MPPTGGHFGSLAAFVNARPNLIANIILGFIGFINLVASAGRPELLASGFLILIAVLVFVVYHSNVLKFPQVRFILYFLYLAALCGALSALIISATSTYNEGAFWGIWNALALPLILGCAYAVYSSGSNNGNNIIKRNNNQHQTTTQTGVASVSETVLDEGQASVIYSHPEGGAASIWKDFTTYRIVYGPGRYTLKANEWCHFFTWTHPWSRPTRYPALGHILSTLEDHIFAKMDGLRTTDNKAIYLDVYIFFRLVDIDRLVKTHLDPIFAFRGVAREDIFRFVAPKNFEDFVRERRRLCELSAFPALLKYAENIGFKITKVTCIDYKDKPQTWKFSNHSGGSDKAGAFKRGKNAVKSDDPHAYSQ